MAIITHKIEGVANGTTLYAKVFTVNPEGRANNRADVPYASAIPSEFPTEPTSYELIDTYTTSQTFTAPEDGYYQIDVHGASGKGGNGYSTDDAGYDDEGDYIISGRIASGGGSGGGSGYGCSIVKLHKGDTLEIVAGSTGNNTTVQINSTIETYSTISVKSAGNGSNGSYWNGGSGGAGGTSEGGNVANLTGSNGETGARSATGAMSNASVYSVAGGAPAHTDGNAGGAGGAASRYSNETGTAGAGGAGKAGFIKIYRGNTNLSA